MTTPSLHCPHIRPLPGHVSHEFGTSGVEDHVRMLLVNLSSAFNTIIPQQQPVLQRGGEAEEMIIESLHSSLKTALHQVSGGGDS